jgi:hypothetical protein
MIVIFPLFRAVSAPSRIASKIFVRLTPALIAASSGVRPSRGMARPVTFGCIVSMAHTLRSAVSNRTQWHALNGEGNIPEIFYFFLGVSKMRSAIS